MKFFIPFAKDAKETEKVYSGIKKFAKETLGWDVTDRKIFRLSYTHNGERRFAEVGKKDYQLKEPIIAILESNAYLICTTCRGVIRGEPLLVGKDPSTSIEEFE